MKSIKWYMAGPMSGIARFNIPAFDQATAELRAQGYVVVSPAERDTWETRRSALASPDGKHDGLMAVVSETWGDMLARDLRIIADEVQGIVLLPGWQRSKGARLESYIGLVAGCRFATYRNRKILPCSRETIKQYITSAIATL